MKKLKFILYRIAELAVLIFGGYFYIKVLGKELTSPETLYFIGGVCTMAGISFAMLNIRALVYKYRRIRKLKTTRD